MPSAAATIYKKNRQFLSKYEQNNGSADGELWLFGTRRGVLSCEDQCGKLDIAVTRQPDCDTLRGYANHYSINTWLIYGY